MPRSYLDNLLTTHRLRKATLTSIIKALQLPAAGKGLDVGCGAGLQCMMLAKTLGPDGHVTGLDIAPEFLSHGEKLVGEAGLSGRITFVEGRADNLPFADDSFDWVWSSDCVGYGPWEPMPMLMELRRIVRPGGTIAILAWSSEHLLPGYPRLEALLGATIPGLAPFKAGLDPSRHFQRSLGLLRELGLENRRAQTFCGSVFAPLDDEQFQGLEALIDMRWPNAAKELDTDDRLLFERITDPRSDDFILRHRDYHAFFTYSMFRGEVANIVT